MIISPPRLRDQNPDESDADWVQRMIPIDVRRDFPLNAHQAWHGGVHLMHSDIGSNVEYIRAIADGTVVSLRQPNMDKRDKPPLNYNGGTDCGYVLLKHETEIGNGEEGKVQYYSLYMHTGSIKSEVKQGSKVYRKDPLGQVGQIDGKNGIHFQIFCDDANLKKLVGRETTELDISKNGRTDIVYGDMHFYLPADTKFYPTRPANNGLTSRENALYQSTEPLYVTMHFDKGSCSMTTRQKAIAPGNGYTEVGDVLVDADGPDYEYNLYTHAQKLYQDSPSAGYELLRFGRVINAEHETLIPANAPLWRTVNYPGGHGVVNLAASEIKKFSDGDFPHWMGWLLVDDDTDTNSQCNSLSVMCRTNNELSRTICHFPLEWNITTAEARYYWLKSTLTDSGIDTQKANDILCSKPDDVAGFSNPISVDFEMAAAQVRLAEKDWNELIAHIKALCFNTEALGLPSSRVWHFEPRQFITHFRKCGWLSHEELVALIPKFYYSGYPKIPVRSKTTWKDKLEDWGDYYSNFNGVCNKYIIQSAERRSIFLGQIYIETNMMATTKEIGKGKKNKKDEWPTPAMEYYQAFYGRGLMQLTWPSNYELYMKYRTKVNLPDVGSDYVYIDSRITLTSNHYWADPRKKVIDKATGKKKNIIDESLNKVWHPRFDPEIIGTDPYCVSDSAGFYWVSKHHDGVININRKSDEGVSSETIGRCSVLVNGGGFGYFERQAYCRYVYYYLGDSIEMKKNESIKVVRGELSVNVIIDYTRQSK